MLINSDERPVRLDADEAEIVYLFKGSLIEVIYMDGSYFVRSRPEGLNMEQTLWPVPRLKDRAKLVKYINRLLACTCVAISRREYISPSERTKNEFNALLESYLNSSRQYGIKVSEYELIGVRSKGACQLTLF